MPGLDGERWRVVSGYLDQALELAGGERRAWLASLREKDEALAAELEALLEERDALSREGFLDPAASPAPARLSLAGQVIGPYTLVSQIGQGGMGNVWLARRSDGRFEGVVAVKLLNAERVGPAGEERFRREGALLARLTHPHIAHLVDAGVSPQGQPYLVLEHVEGEPIDRYCDRHGLAVDARVRLFLDVLAAVAHAHANLIVHRDVKPSNVLVRQDGAVKLLDFGIAKLLAGEGSSGEETALTREGGRALTPEYAAPEQLTGAPITTATDVYALGGLLYLLLAGRHPAAGAGRSPAEIVRAIVETEPPRLSAAALTAGADGPPRRAPRGDLDVIVAQALKKDPAKRYASVTAFADDLRRYLAHEPISARADKVSYRAAMFLRRNRVPVALGVLAVLALAAGVVASTVEAHRAGEQRDFALRQLSRAEAINDLNSFLLSDAAPSGKPFTAGELLARAESVVDHERGETDENRAEMLIAVGRQYQIQDEDANARRLLTRAYELARGLSDPSIRANAACSLASALARTGEFERAETLLRAAERDLPHEPQYALHRVNCLMRAGEVARSSGDAKSGIERVEAARRVLQESHLKSALLELRLSIELAEAYRTAGRSREAARLCADAYSRLESLGRDGTETAGTLLNNWGLALFALGQPLEAERLLRQAVRISSRDGTDRGVSPMLLTNLAAALTDTDRLGEAEDCAHRAYEKASQAGDEVIRAQALNRLVALKRLRGDLAGAERGLSELEVLWRSMPPGHVVHAVLASHHSLLAQARGELPVALAAADRAVTIADGSPLGREYLPMLLLRRSEVELQMARAEPAEADAARALRSEQALAQPGTPSCRLGRAYLGLARALRARGRLDEARSAFRSALEQLQPTLGSGHAAASEARLALAGAPSTR